MTADQYEKITGKKYK
ncbi:hypothetical protein FAX13_03545 [Ligilactobacillus animalis]|nr:hypothetical protein FAX13_03545 [Ligilactobacillus animalis]